MYLALVLQAASAVTALTPPPMLRPGAQRLEIAPVDTLVRTVALMRSSGTDTSQLQPLGHQTFNEWRTTVRRQPGIVVSWQASIRVRDSTVTRRVLGSRSRVRSSGRVMQRISEDGRRATSLGRSALTSGTLATRRDSLTGLTFVQLPPGQTPALCQITDTACLARLTRPSVPIPSFWMMATDVTAAAYAACASAGRCTADARARDEQKDRCNWTHDRRDHPMNCVTWTEASTFCRWLAARLPTSLEWEYAATSGIAGRVYPWGDAPVDGTRADYCDRRCPDALGTDGKNLERWQARGLIDYTSDDGFAATAPVGSYPAGATPWGLLDMAGNVWQWTATADTADTREVRGGSWDNAPALLRTDRRLPWPAARADAGMGFRCVRGDST